MESEDRKGMALPNFFPIHRLNLEELQLENSYYGLKHLLQFHARL